MLDVDLVDPSADRVDIGDYIPNIVYINRDTNTKAVGGGGGGGRIFSGLGDFYDFGPDNAKIGPWNINEDSISTETGSILGASGTMILTNEKAQLNFSEDGTFLVGNDKYKYTVNGSDLELVTPASTFKVGHAYMQYDTEGCDLYVGTATGFYVSLGTTKAISVNTRSGVTLTDGDTKLILNGTSLTIDDYSVDNELKTYTFKTSWNKKSSFQVYKGFVVKVDDETDEEEGQQLGDLAWLDKVVISSATFKLGSSAISMTQSTDGGNATFTGSIPVSS